MARFTAVTDQITNTIGDKFIPEIWSDEVIAVYEKSLALAPRIRKMSMKGKKGDVIHVPKPVRNNTVFAKVANQAVNVQATAATELLINIDQHWEYSVMLEDITATQALASLRKFYTDDAGYQMAKNVDTSLLNLGVGLDGDAISLDPTLAASWAGTSSFQSNGAGTANTLIAFSATAATAIAAFDDGAFRAGIQKLDDNDVPMSDRFFSIPPVLSNTLRGITRFSSSDFVNSGKVTSGNIGSLYGVDIVQTTNAPAFSTTGTVTNVRACLLAHKDVYVLAEQMGVRTQTQYKQEHLSTLMTTDRLYGRQVYRKENGINIMVLA